MSKRKNETHEEYLARRRIVRRKPELLAREAARSARYRLKNPEKVKERWKSWYAKNPGILSRLKSAYGITRIQYDGMYAAQKGVCAACGKPPREGRPLCVDHCHKTKVVRGLLCDPCNICAGYIESIRFEQVKAYLARQTRLGWTCWGNETTKFDPAVERLSEPKQESWDEMWEKPFPYPERL